jgi:GNAT superfamily N-acetyltransferase
MHTRLAQLEDAEALAALINLSYRVEDFFKIGDRTDATEVRAKMKEGVFILLEDGDRRIAGAVYVTSHDRVGYFGMLSIDPPRQGQGLGSRLIGEAEDHCRRAGCTEMELEVVNLRTELPPYYRRFGYVERGTRPFTETERTSQPCHFIVMSKPLGG